MEVINIDLVRLMTQPYGAPKSKTNSFKESILSPDTIVKLVTGTKEVPGTHITKLIFALTINPCDQFQFFKEKQKDRLTKATNHMKHIMRNLPNIHMVMWLDVSRTGRIHWHGTLTFTSMKEVGSWYTEIVPNLMRQHQIELDTISDINKWDVYCEKVRMLWDIHLCTADLIADKLATKEAQKSKMFKPIDSYACQPDPYDHGIKPSEYISDYYIGDRSADSDEPPTLEEMINHFHSS